MPIDCRQTGFRVVTSATTAAVLRPKGPAPVTLGNPKLAIRPRTDSQEIPRAFQVLLAIYVILTGDFPTILQAVAFGVPGGGDAEFALAMLTSLCRDILLLLPVVVFARHPLGIVHPLILAVVVWPLVIGMPKVIEEFGGWVGIFAGLPVRTPYYIGLRSLDPSTVWAAITKYNVVQILALASTYFGFWLFRAKRSLSRIPVPTRNTRAIRTVMLGLICISMLILVIFVYFRGGLSAHVTSLGQGRFRELAGAGPVIAIITLATIALYVWIAARPGDARSPLFLASLAAAAASQFIANGSRGGAMMVPLTAGIIWSIGRRKVPWRLALAFIPVMFLAIGLLGAVRTSSWYGASAGEAWSQTSLAESFEKAQEETVRRQAASGSVPVVARGFEVSGGPMLGQTYLAAFTGAIPRALWEEKPRGAGSIYAQIFLGRSGDGLGIPVSAPAEMYWNFGWLGLVLLSILYGALLRAAYHFLWRKYPDPFAIVFVAIVATSFQFSTKLLVDFQQRAGLLLICYLAVAFLFPKRAASVHNRVSDAVLRVPSRA